MLKHTTSTFCLLLATVGGLANMSLAAAQPTIPAAGYVQLAQIENVGPDAPQVTRQRIVSSAEQRAQALLETAEQYVRTHGAEGARDFSHLPQFVDRDLYVFALGMDGVLLGSGGWSASLVGQNVADETDTHGNHFFERMISLAREQERGQVQYFWYNPASANETRKVTNFVRVGDVIVAVGFFPERGTRTEARAMLRAALLELEQRPSEALSAFQDPNGPFKHDDLYVFAVDTRTGTFVAHGATPGLVGSNAVALLDASGRNPVREMVEAAQRDGHGSLDYLWINPMTGRIESKRTYFRKQGDLMIAVGSYDPTNVP
ncbi:cache domain-containing protein [Alcaligenaceae bacterium]|nr:cache domain-containing protein [Alcaligenaceae bacterium]